jgi:diadenosine tetraphosphate (Ap4A) HIT family hydrolase
MSGWGWGRAGLVAAILFALVIGFFVGAASIHRPIPGAPVELPPARNPWRPEDVLGLLGSIGIRGLAGHLERVPSVVVETDRTFAIELPARADRVHYVLVPKKDIRDVGQITAEDQPYLTDVFVTARRLAEKEKLKDYRLYTNSRDLQSVAYLHFHLIGRRERK